MGLCTGTGPGTGTGPLVAGAPVELSSPVTMLRAERSKGRAEAWASDLPARVYADGRGRLGLHGVACEDVVLCRAAQLLCKLPRVNCTLESEARELTQRLDVLASIESDVQMLKLHFGMMPPPPPSVPAPPIFPSLLAYYPFDGDSRDLSHNGRNGSDRAWQCRLCRWTHWQGVEHLFGIIS